MYYIFDGFIVKYFVIDDKVELRLRLPKQQGTTRDNFRTK